jgi:7-carboxy-7-deazaguanine synthase
MDTDKLYRVKEIFYSLQGEGAQTGRPAVFCRFSKCNLWNGREDSRESAICHFCDTDFVGTDGQNGGTYTMKELVAVINGFWPTPRQGKPYVICTGGEPALQLDQALVDEFHKTGFEVAIETNGTLPLPDGIDWICLSPKGRSTVILTHCNELKLVYPQTDAMPEQFAAISAEHRYLQPMAPLDHSLITSESQNLVRQTIAYCLANPCWKLSLQTHKWLGID